MKATETSKPEVKNLPGTGPVVFAVLFLLACVLLLPAGARATEGVYEFPKIEPEYHLELGVSLIDVEGSRRTAEYNYTKNSPTLDIKYIAFPFPRRIHMEADFENEKSGFEDVRYAYGDGIVLRWVYRIFYHNLARVPLEDLGGDPRFTVDDRSGTGFEPGFETQLGDLKLRTKPFDYPFHLFLNHRYLMREGTVQERFLGGSGFYDDLERTSVRRNIKTEQTSTTIGTNAHLWPIEAEYSYEFYDFDVRTSQTLYDSYGPAGSRPAGVYGHNSIPESLGHNNTIKVHTMLTGQIVASATLLWGQRENEYSESEVEHYGGGGDLTWTPSSDWTVFLRYRLDHNSVDTPLRAVVTDSSNSSNRTVYRVLRPSMDSENQDLTAKVRYRITSRVTLTGEAARREAERTPWQPWMIPHQTVTERAAIKGRALVTDRLTVKAEYAFENNEAPAYNTQPDKESTVSVSATWLPFDKVTAFLKYDRGKGDRPVLHFTDENEYQRGQGERNTETNRIFGSLAFSVRPDLTLTLSHAYFGSQIDQPIIYDSLNSPGIQDGSVEYHDLSRLSTLGIDWAPSRRMDVNLGVSLVRSEAHYSPTAQVALQPENIAVFSDLDIREVEYEVGGEYRFGNDWRLSLDYRYTSFDDLNKDSYLWSEGDGDSQRLVMNVSKVWR